MLDAELVRGVNSAEKNTQSLASKAVYVSR